MSTRSKAFVLWLGTLGGFFVSALALLLLDGPDSPWVIVSAATIPVGYLISRFWPRCSHCGSRVFGFHLMPLFSDECMHCGQDYDRPRVDEDALARRGIERMVAEGRLPPSALEPFNELGPSDTENLSRGA
jgi:hypothetical protein